jgi:hypothetical protein
MANGKPRVAAIAGASAFDALARREITERLPAAAARIGNASALALEVGGARGSRRWAVTIGDALYALSATPRADGGALGAVAVVYARYADFALRLAKRTVGARAIRVGNAADARSAAGVALRSFLAHHRAARAAGRAARVIVR